MKSQISNLKSQISQKGFTLIEALVFLFIFSIITISFYGAFNAGVQFIIDAKNRLGAIELANERMEIIRNMNYSDVGTKVDHGGGVFSYGVPAGEILQDEDIAANTRQYHVHTDIRYHDDPFDGTALTDPVDTVNNDYKKVRVDVTWQWNDREHSISLVSDFVPQGVETSAGGGTLVVNVYDKQGNPVPQAEVKIVNGSISPSVEITTTTDDNGSLLLPGMPNSNNQNTYVIRASKSSQDYETLETLPLYPTTSFDPLYAHVMILEGELSSVYMEIDKTADLDVKTIDFNNNPVGNIDFKIAGGKIIGTNHETGDFVYSTEGEEHSTDGNGESSLSDVSSGVYLIELTEEEKEDYQLFGTDPIMPLNLDPGSELELSLIVVDRSTNSLIVTVTDNNGENPTPIKNASVNLINNSIGYDEVQNTGDDGKVYFPGPENSLQNEQYDLEIHMDGYQDYSGSVDVDGLEEETITLNPS